MLQVGPTLYPQPLCLSLYLEIAVVVHRGAEVSGDMAAVEALIEVRVQL